MENTSLFSQMVAATIAPATNTYFSDILTQMFPFCYVAIPLIVLDLYYGRKKAQYQYENGISTQRLTIQKSIKMTIQKVFNYISWIFLSVSLSLAFNMPSLVIIIMAIIYGLEVMSLLNKYCESKGIDIDEVGMLKLLFKFIWQRITGINNERFDDIVKRHQEGSQQEINNATKSEETRQEKKETPQESHEQNKGEH